MAANAGTNFVAEGNGGTGLNSSDLKSMLPYILSMLGNNGNMGALGFLLGMWGMNELGYRHDRRNRDRENKGYDKVNGNGLPSGQTTDDYGSTVLHAAGGTSTDNPVREAAAIATGNVTPPSDQLSLRTMMLNDAAKNNFGLGNDKGNLITENLTWSPGRALPAIALAAPAASPSAQTAPLTTAAAPGSVASGLFGRLFGGQNPLNPNELPQLYKVLGGL